MSRKKQAHQECNASCEKLLVPKVHPEWTSIIWQDCISDGDVKAGKNSLSSNVMCYKCNALNVCCKNHLLLYLPKNAANMLQGLAILITTMQLMELSEKTKYLTKEHVWTELNKPLDDIKLCVILLCMVI